MIEFAESLKQQNEKENRKQLGNDLGDSKNMVGGIECKFTKKGVVSLPFANLSGPSLAGSQVR